VEYEYTLYDVITYEDQIDPEIPVPKQEDRVIVGTRTTCRIIFNKFRDSVGYRDHLFSLVEKYKNRFVEFIDNDNYSVSERLRYFEDRLAEIGKIKKSVFHINKSNQYPSRHEETVINEQGGEGNFLKAQNDFIKYGEMIYGCVHVFIDVQFESLLHLERLLNNAARFIPGRLTSYKTESDADKLPFRSSKVDLLLLMVALKDLGIIAVESDHQLAKFMERNFLYNRKHSLKAVKIAISQYRSGEKNIATSLESIREKLKPLFDPKFSIKD
jgi:hypothetical protein